VVIWIADSGCPPLRSPLRSAKTLRANTSCTSAPARRPLAVTKTSTTSCIVAGHGAAQQRLERVGVVAQPQVLQQQPHHGAVARVAHALVVERAHAAGQRLAQRAQAAAGVEGLVLGAVQAEVLQPLQRQQLDRLPVVDRLAGVAVLVDQPVHAPGQVVLQRVGRERGQRAHAHLHLVHLVEALRQVVRDDAHEARRQPALRHEGRGRALGQARISRVAATSSVRSK
jgi:hypothetical protein